MEGDRLMAGWNWSAFTGSEAALKWNRRDLPNLDRVIAACPQRRVAVQAGGHLGLFPKRLAETFATVYTFEPAADLFAALMHNAPEPNIIKFQAAVGDDRNLVGLSRVRRKNDGGPIHEGLTHVSGEGVIPTLRIDDLGLTTCDLLQLDLEGWELPALRGALRTIEICRPVLAIEVNENQRYVGSDEEQLRQAITALGYRLSERLQSDELYLPVELAMRATA